MATPTDWWRYVQVCTAANKSATIGGVKTPGAPGGWNGEPSQEI